MRIHFTCDNCVGISFQSYVCMLSDMRFTFLILLKIYEVYCLCRIHSQFYFTLMTAYNYRCSRRYGAWYILVVCFMVLPWMVISEFFLECLNCTIWSCIVVSPYLFGSFFRDWALKILEVQLFYFLPTQDDILIFLDQKRLLYLSFVEMFWWILVWVLMIKTYNWSDKIEFVACNMVAKTQDVELAISVNKC